MDATIKVLLTDEQQKELNDVVYNTLTDAIHKARQEEQHAKPYLNKTEMSKWLGISMGTLNNFIHNGLPVANIDGTKLIGKETALQFLKDHEESI